MTALNLSHLRVLVIDDNALARDMIKFALYALNVRDIYTVENGEQGLELMRSIGPDLALVDWMMAPVDGLEFVRRVRADTTSSLRFLPIIMVTAYAEVWRVREARDAGANEFVAKPFSAHTLYAKIRSIIENPRPFIEGSAYFGPDRRRRAQRVAEDRRVPTGNLQDANENQSTNYALAS